MAEDTLKDALLNPKRVLQKREEEAEHDPKKGRDAGQLPGEFQMSQSAFSGYDKTKKDKKK